MPVWTMPLRRKTVTPKPPAPRPSSWARLAASVSVLTPGGLGFFTCHVDRIALLHVGKRGSVLLMQPFTRNVQLLLTRFGSASQLGSPSQQMSLLSGMPLALRGGSRHGLPFEHAVGDAEASAGYARVGRGGAVAIVRRRWTPV